MKYKKKLARLKARQDWWDRQSKDYQAANKKPGSIKKDNMKVYVMVSFPEIQDFMEHPRWNECIFANQLRDMNVQIQPIWFRRIYTKV